MRKILCFLFILFFLNSCSVYHSRSVSLEEAVESKNRVKVITENGVSYKFRRLQMENAHLVGLAHTSSNTARKISGLPVEKKGKFLHVNLLEDDIQELRLRNDALSILISILIPLAAITIPILVFAAGGPGLPGYP